MKAPAVYVEWVDTFGFAGGPWHEASDWERAAEEHLGKPTNRSIGWIVYEDENWIVIGGHDHIEETRAGGCMAIPKRAITKRRRVKLP